MIYPIISTVIIVKEEVWQQTAMKLHQPGKLFIDNQL
jgi:hypothetical protein